MTRAVPANRTAGARLSSPIRRCIVLLAILALLPLGAAASPQAGQAFQEMVDSESNEALFETARMVFNSADQPDSVALFSRLIARLELAGDPSLLPPEDRALLTQSLYFRSRAGFNLGNDDQAEADLRRVLTTTPGFRLERAMVSPKLAELFDAIRAQLIGELQLTVVPEDAVIVLGDEVLEIGYDPLPLLAGTHSLRIERPGYAPFLQQVELSPAELLPLTVQLDRTSAVLRLHTRPVGAEVFLDGVSIGTTSGEAPRTLTLRGDAARYAVREFSAALMVDGVQQGTHTVQLRYPGHRVAVTEIEVTALADLDIGGLALERLRGTLALRALPAEATTAIEGQAVSLQTRTIDETEVAAAELDPGSYTVTVTGAAGNVFETEAIVRDREVTMIDVDMRPSIAFLGVLGEDTVGAERITSALESRFGSDGYWMYLDRSAADRRLLGGVGLAVDELRDLAQLASPNTGSIDWPGVQSGVAADVRGSVYLLAVLNDDLLATHVDLWLWPSAPGPATPDRVRLALDDAATIERFVDSLNQPFSNTRPWFGAVLVDSDAAQGPVVFDVTAGSPAATAGLTPGDEIISVGRDTAGTAAQVLGWLEARDPATPTEMIYRRRGADTRTTIAVGTSPSVVPGGLPTMAYAAVWAASLAQLGAADPAVPQWIAELNLANVLMQAGAWDAAVRRLRSIEAPAESDFARAMVDYQLGIALEAVGPQYLELARDAYTRAAQVEGARLWHRDGPYLQPRALARLATLGGPSEAR